MKQPSPFTAINLYSGQNYNSAPMFLYTTGNQTQQIDYDAFRELGLGLAQVLKNGAAGAVISIMHNGPEWDIIDFACYTNGITHVSLHPLTDAPLLEKIWAEIKPAFAFVSHNHNIRRIEKIIGTGSCKLVPLHTQKQKDNFFAQLKAAPPKNGTPANIGADAIQTIIYTSGSAGISKGVLLSRQNISSAVSTFSSARFFEGCKRALSVLPISLSGERKLNYSYKVRGISICYPSPLQSLEDALLFFEPDIVALVPFLLEQLKQVIETTGNRFTFLKAIVCGGAAIPVDTLNFFEAHQIPVYELYGLTETASVLSYNDKGAIKKGTVGKPAATMQVKIADDGEILGKGNNVCNGYLNNDEATASLFTADGFLHTGDLGHLDEEGFLTVTGRKKNVFKNSRGVYISPEELENKIKAHPLIQNAIVLGENAPTVKAVLLTKTRGIDSNTISVLRQWVAHCNQTLKEYEQIGAIYLYDVDAAKQNNLLTLSLKVNRAQIMSHISEKEPITLY